MSAPGWPDLWRAFGKIGLLSFGGPAAQIAVMHRELVDRRAWLTEAQFLTALSFCMLLPGPEAMQLATYSGWRLRGTAGGLLAGLLFVLPGALVMLALSLAYVQWGGVPGVQDAFAGIKAAVIVIVLQALRKVAGKALKAPDRWVIAGLAFVAIFALGLPFPLIILGAGLYGALTARPQDAGAPFRPNVAGTLRTVAVWLALWWAPVAALAALGATRLTDVALFFSKLAVVTFGGAYAVLAYMAQAAVTQKGWLSAEAMIDGLGLAETTPGPLILVTQFVAHLAGQQAGGVGLAIAAAAITLWVTFVPCFLWIFAGAPYVEQLSARPRLSAALSAITAAVVGVILNLSIWFALHVLFADVPLRNYGPVHMPVPQWDSLIPSALGLVALAAVLMRARLGLTPVLVVMAGAGLAIGRLW